MNKTIVQLRRGLVKIGEILSTRQSDPWLSEHDRNNLAHAEAAIGTARLALFHCEKQS